MTTERRHDIFAVALLVLLPTIFFWDVLTGVNGFYVRDLSRVQFPMKHVLHDIVRAGQLPYWNRLLSAGQPLAANPAYAVFYPPSWLTLLPDFEFGFRQHIVLHIYLALIGMYALLRSMRLRIEAAVFGAIAFGLGGLTLSLVNLLPLFFCAAWIPLTLLFTARFLTRPNPRDFALASIILALQCLAGNPAMLAQTLIITALFALDVRRSVRSVAWIIAIAVSAALAAAVQVIPSIDFMREAVTSGGTRISMPVAKLAELVFPNILGHVSINGLSWYWAARLYPGSGMPYVFSIYSGLAIAALSIAGLVRRVRGAAVTATLLALSVLISMWSEQFVFMGVFGLIVFGARALDRMLGGDSALIEVASGFTIASGLLALLVYVLTTMGGSVSAFLNAFGLEPSGGAMLMAVQARSDWLTAAARALALIILLLTIHRARPAVWALVALLFLCFDLTFVVSELNPRMPRQFFVERSPLADALPGNQSGDRVYHEAAWSANTPAGRSFFRPGPQSDWVARNGLFPPINAEYGVVSVMEPDIGTPRLPATAAFLRAVRIIRHSGRANWWRPLMAMSNASYRAIYNNYEEEQRATGGDATKLVPVALQEEEGQPRYWFAAGMVTIAGVNDFVNATNASLGRNIALVNVPSFAPAPGVVRRVQETANDAMIDVTADGRSLLVMSVTPDKYWIVRIDGQAARPITTNLGYQSIIIPAGQHIVTMRYRNSLIPIGALISLLSLVILCVVALIWRRA